MDIEELDAKITVWLSDVRDFGRMNPVYDQGYEDALLRIHQLIDVEKMDTYTRREEIATSEREKLRLERQLRRISDYIADLWVEDERD